MKLIKLIQEIYEVNKTFISTRHSQRADREINYKDLYDKIHHNYQPCFVLSTGRCGTKLLTKILNVHPKVQTYHSPDPELIFHSRIAYDNFIKQIPFDKLTVDASRYELIKATYLRNKQYVETNNRITFFAFELYKLFPNAKFIHLIRNPESFVRSGVSRKWYSGYHPYDEGRIQPVNEFLDQWKNFELARKVAWLWNETNSFIESFKKSIPITSVLLMKSEDLFTNINSVNAVFKFLNLTPISNRRISGLLKKPVNKQKILYDLTNLEKALIIKETPIQELYY